MRHLLRITTIGLFALSSSAAIAAFSEQPTLSVSATFMDADDDRGALATDQNGHGFSLGLLRKINDRLFLEGQLGTLKLDDNAGDELRQTNAGINAGIRLNNSQHFAPYFLVGAGFQRSELSNGEKAQNHYADLGLGIFHKLTPGGLAVRADVRLRRDFFDTSAQGTTEFDDIVANVGISLPLGQTRAVGEEAYPDIEEYERSQDSDSDGIADNADFCPRTNLGVAVDINGCSEHQLGLAQEPESTEEAAEAPQQGAAAESTSPEPAFEPEPTPAPSYSPAPAIPNAFALTFVGNTTELDSSGQSAQLQLARELLHRKDLVADILANSTANNDLNARRANAVARSLKRFGIHSSRYNVQTSASVESVEARLRVK